jgi:predicted kinase/predicted phosphodiesterase
MRNLIILRGSPASGKSTYIKEHNLENYTLSADNIRLLFESPIIVPDKLHRVISQKNDSYVWALLFELLEKRMARGELVVVDATHSRSSDFSRYNKLCERYRYRRYYLDFSDVSIEECKKRNSLREDYKRVPESVIDKMYSRLRTQGKTSGWVKLNKETFPEEIEVKLFDLNAYKKIHIFGDIHGCYEPLKKYFEDNPYSQDEMYIFCGDYIDRGVQNKETMEFLLTLYQNKNVLFLEGNHEKWMNYYALDELERIKSNQFLKHTIFELESLQKKELRTFYRKLGQLAYFEYDDNKYLVSHGGLSFMPSDLQNVATEQLINGVGDYNVDIDDVWAKNYKDVIQIHGHRNTFEIDDVDNKSYNLEGKIEFGGNLKVLQLEKGQKPKIIKIKNDVFGKKINEEEQPKKILKEIPIIEQLRLSSDIRETELDDNISSFNFTHKAFYNKNWNDLTCKARGLFLDTNSGKVVARGYEKFFNVNEKRETELEHLIATFKGKITCYKKENGFLGIMSWVNGKLFMASKSTNVGTYAEYFKKIYEESNIDKEKLEDYLQKNNVSLTFEVIDIENDPHIIEYDKSKIVLLDIIYNDFEFKKAPYKEVQRLAELVNCECKTIYKEFDNVRDFHRWYLENTDEEDLSKDDIEGVVIENNNFMTKLKFPYYNFWKLMRSVKDKVLHKREVKFSRLYNATSNYFYAWLKQQDEETLQKDIITLRKMFYKEKGE